VVVQRLAAATDRVAALVAEMAARFARYPASCRPRSMPPGGRSNWRRSAPVAELDVPDDQTPDSYLAALASVGSNPCTRPGTHAAARHRLDQELELIAVRDFAGYF